MATTNNNLSPVIHDLLDLLSTNPQTSADSLAIPVAAIHSLLRVINRSTSKTMQGLNAELREATAEMLSHANSGKILNGRSVIPLQSGCQLFLRYITRVNLDNPNFDDCIAGILERGKRFAELSLSARDKIADCGANFIQDGSVVLTHGCSRVVNALLVKASLVYKKNFEVIVLEGRPEGGGVAAAKMLKNANIPTTVVLDSAMGFAMERVSMVLVGAEGIVENGGVINKIGTFPLAVVASSMNKPVYVAAESYKFARLFPLNNADLPNESISQTLTFVDTTKGNGRKEGMEEGKEGEVCKHEELNMEGIKIENPACDYTPAKYITLLFTDLGVLTPSAVSDELIRLYQ